MSEPLAPIATVRHILQQRYPASGVERVLDSGAELPLTGCPRWWRPFARRRWIRDMNGRIALARIYGWRTNRGPARHHLFASTNPAPGQPPGSNTLTFTHYDSAGTRSEHPRPRCSCGGIFDPHATEDTATCRGCGKEISGEEHARALFAVVNKQPRHS